MRNLRGNVMTVEQADVLVSKDPTVVWWETWGKTLVSFRPGRGGNTQWRKDGFYNRAWRGKQKWGTVKRIEVSEDGLFRL